MNRSAVALVWLGLTQFIALASLLAWFPLVGFSLMAFDSGAPPPQARAMLAMIWGYPLLPIVCSILAWRAWRAGNTRRSMIATSLPLLWPLVMAGIFLWM